MTVFLCDRDHVISASGNMKRELADHRISAELEALMDSRGSFVMSKGVSSLKPVLNSAWQAAVAFTIIGGGDVSGAVVLMQNLDGTSPDEADVKLAQVAASFLGKQTEE